MTPRRLETALARFTLGTLVIYIPAETWLSLPNGLAHPMYLVDVVAMALMLWGSLYSLRARPSSGAGPLAAGWAWAAANGWRATSWRWLDTRSGGELEHGFAELIATAAGTALALLCLTVALWLVTRPTTQAPQPR